MSGPMIFENILQPFGTGSAAVYLATEGVQRWFAEGCPYHIAVHEVRDVDERGPYCREHIHGNCDEINVLIPGERGLVMEVLIGSSWRDVSAPATVVFPAGVPHVAQVKRGGGFVVVAHMLPKDQEVPVTITGEFAVGAPPESRSSPTVRGTGD